MGRGATAAVVALLYSADRVQAEDKEPFAVLELGGAGEWSFPDSTHVLGPSIAAEFDVIKEWLEIEVGDSTLFRRGHTEWGTELLFKKPFILSDQVEFMLGLGPAWSYTTGGVPRSPAKSPSIS
jgi:hypothetical protein